MAAIGMPLCRPLAGSLWEVRSQISNGKIARVIFCVHEENMVLLHGFIKKSQKTPIQDLQLAKRRQRTLMQ